MHAIEAILGRPEVERLGWVLLHFVWQGVVGAGVLAAALFALRRASANARYLASCAALAAMAACLPVTWLLLPQRPAAEPAEATAANVSPTMQFIAANDSITSADRFTPGTSTLVPTDAVVIPPRFDAPAAQQTVVSSAQLTWRERLAIGLPWFTLVWVAGVLVLSIRLAVGWTTIHKLRRAASQPIGGDKQAAMTRLAGRLGIRWPVKLLESAVVEVPTMIGWLRPAVLWPPAMLTGLSTEQFESLLAHELAHIRRHDYLVNLIQTAIETLLFYHPAVWWVSSRIRHERECCCDDLAVAVCGNRLSYARALAVVEELRPRPRQFALAADGGRLLTRVRRIVGVPGPHSGSGRHWILGVSLSVILSVVVVAVGISSFATGDEPPSTKTEPKSPAESADTAKTTDPAKSHTAKVRMPYDISVQKLRNSDWDNLLPEKLADRIRQLPHVTRVVPTLFSDSPFAYGVPSDFPATFSKQKIVSGRLPAAGERRKVIVGKTLAEKAGYKVGDVIKFFDQKVEVIGIFESPFDPLNFSTQLPLAELQEIMHAERRLNELLVNVDIPQDGSVDHERQFAELRAGIAKLGDADSSELSIIEVNKPPPKPAPDAAWVPSSLDKDAIELSGQVVDDQTGKPIPFFHRQGGQAFTFNTQWGLSEWWSESSEGEGRFTLPINWRGGWRARVVAGGYVPERILTKPPDPTKSSIEGIVVRMKRGRTVAGRLVDHSGKPVAGASLFVIGPLNSSTQLRISEGKAFVGNKDQWIEDVSIPPFKTDADGRFTVTGVGWDAKFIAVSCSAFDLWVASAPNESQSRDFEIRLPQPAKLIVHYDIPGAADEAEVALWPENKQIYPGTRGPEGPGTFISVDSEGRSLDWTSNVFYNRIGTAKQHGELVIDNLPAGEYVVQRVKEFETVLGVNGKVGVNRHVVKLAAGTTTAVDWVRKTGAAVEGQIVGLENTRVRGLAPAQLFVTVEPAVQPNPSQAIDYSYVDIIHKDNESREAKFKTEQLPPGKYRIVAKVFEDSSSRLTTLDGNPTLIGEATVDVPENGSSPPIKIEVHKFSKPAKSAPKNPDPAPAPASPAKEPALLIRTLSGHVVDDETGKPVQGFVYDLAKFDDADPARFHWNGDAIGPGSQKDGAFGITVKNQIGRPVWARIAAPGYVPQPITEKPIVLAEDSVLDKFEVRMHRGKTLAGRVVDSSGNPVADAGVYLLRNQGSRQVVRDPAAGSHQQFEMLTMTNVRTDADGRFKLTGWDAESGRVAVMSAAMNLWVTPIHADASDWTIHLPTPAAIECLVDNDRGELNTLYDLDFVTTGRKGWELLRAYQFSLNSKDGKLSIANHTPGQYELVRRRRVKVAEYEGEFKLAEVKLQVDPSNTFTIDLRHPVGWPIAGQIAGLKELGLSGAIISVEPPGEVKRGQMTFDATTCGEDGRFETGHLAPGKYRVHVDGYLPKEPIDPRAFRGGVDLPDTARLPAFTADVEVTITKDQQPDNLKLELKKGGESRAFREIIQYHEQPQPAAVDEFTAPPWAVAGREVPKSNHPTPDASPTLASKVEAKSKPAQILFVVQASGEMDTAHHLPIELGDRIKKLPHVVRVSGGLIDVVGFPEYEQNAVIVSGLPPDSPLFDEWKVTAGRMLRADDHHVVVLGSALAKQMQKGVGDKINAFVTEIEIVGVFDSKNVFEKGSLAVPLSDLQEFMDLSKKVSSFFVATDIARDDSAESKSQIREFKNRIKVIDKQLVAMEIESDRHSENQPAERAKAPDDQAAAPKQPMPEPKPIQVRGQVVDDATGKPITLFDKQGGHVDPKDPSKINWGYYLEPNAGGAEGRFDANIDWNGGWRARIIASGYVPQPILTEPPKAGQTKIEVVLRMKRGREVSGRVVDHAGKPVKDAGLFIVGSRPVNISGGKALTNNGIAMVEDKTVVRYSTDADGKFTLAGIGEDSKSIAVSYPALDLWVVAVPSAEDVKKGFEIRLPEPGKLIIHYEIPGGPDEASLFFQMHTWDRKGWEGVENLRYPTVKQNGELVLDNMPPGLYEVIREKKFNFKSFGTGAFLDRRQVTIEAGKTVTSDFIRKSGAPVTGQVVGLDRDDVQKAKPTGVIVGIHRKGDERESLAPKFDEVALDPFDKSGKPSDGSFKTETIPPGEYQVSVAVFIEETPEQRHRTGIIPPGFEGEATVTVPEQGAPPPVKIELKPWEYKAPESKKTEAAKETPKETPKESPKVTTSKDATTTEYKPVIVYGQAIDDETGKPVTVFDTQGGRVDEKDPTKVAWGYWLRPNAGGSEGRFDVSVDWNAGWRARVVASGYVPQPILIEPPKPGATKVEGLVIRMKRGRTVHGRLVDHEGKPVKNAALFVVGSRPLEITGDHALMNSSQGPVEDHSAGHHATDADGRFTLTGIGEDAMCIAVSCTTVDLWIVPAPTTDEAEKDFEIRLPEPGKLIVHYDIPGGPEETTIFLQLHTWDREGWKGVDNRRRPSVKQHGELVLDNMTPGLYEVIRESGGFLDRRQVTIEPGKTVTSDFIRKAGAPITGRIVGLDREDVQKAKPKHINISVHKPGEERNPVATKFAAVQMSAIGKDGKPSDGFFKTEIIPPGEYLVRASVFLEEPPERGYRTGLIPPGFEGEAKVTVPEQGAPPPVEIQLKKWVYKPFEFKTADAPKVEAPKEAPKTGAGESPPARGSNRLSEPPADKNVDDVVKQGLQAIGAKQGDEASQAAITKGLLYLAKKQAEEATANERLNEVKITVDPALAAELRALDAMRAGTSTPFDKVDEIGRKLLEKYQKPEEQGQIYYMLLQVHGQSGLVTPNHIITYAQQALKYPLSSRQEMMVYIYWGDTLNVQRTEKPLSQRRQEAAAVYLKGLKLVWPYPETPPDVPDPPPLSDDPNEAARAARQKAWEHYQDLHDKADFIKEVNYHRAIFIRQIADMYHRLPAATPDEIAALRKRATEIVGNDAAVARLMAAVSPGDKAGEHGTNTRQQLYEAEMEAALAKDPRLQQAMNELSRLMREETEIQKDIKDKDDPSLVRVRDAIKSLREKIEQMKSEVKQQLLVEARLQRDKGANGEEKNNSLTKAAMEALIAANARDERPWSQAVGGVTARLGFERGREANGTRIIATYLELRNVSDSATPIEIPLDPTKIEFKAIDANDKEVAQAGLPYDGMTALPGVLRVPHDSELRLGVSGNGAGIPKDAGTLLDLASSAVWLFKPGDTGEYRLQAKFTIEKKDDHSWHGTIEVPAARIPLGK